MPYTDKRGTVHETITVPNPDVLRAGIRHIEDDLAHWDQGDWLRLREVFVYPDEPEVLETCRTTACLAGHILLAQGSTWRQLVKHQVAGEAMTALGFGEGGEADRFFQEIFQMTETADVDLAFDEEALVVFKARITEVTGVDF
jgi:hypothetical protein